ncbi:MAG TPA: bifunctional YncE family protein/alkaline phosphatase family protein [Terracidiphilus sp.]|nr:bifunctional YncE family protein/alkaline phosphatase family protein [Terracidiphilus sp.]
MTMIVSPNNRYVVTVNAGYGTYESDYDQSIAVLDSLTGKLEDFPDSRTLVQAKQTLYSGLAFSRDGNYLYASMGSITDPLGERPGDTGSGVVVYRFDAGKIKADRFIKLPLQHLSSGHVTKLLNDKDGDLAIPFPAAIADVMVHGTEKLLVAENLSDDVLLLDPETGAIEHKFDLTENSAVPSTYPIALAVTKDEKRAFVALWNASEVVELDLNKLQVKRKLALLKPSSRVAPGSHPSALLVSGSGKTLYVALSNRDAVAAINIEGKNFKLKGYFDTRLPGQSYFGAEPVGLTQNPNTRRVYVANAAIDAVAVLDPKNLTKEAAEKGMVEPTGFIPTEWMPMCVAYAPTLKGERIYIATAKGKGTGPNGEPMKETDNAKGKHFLRRYTYIASMLHGSIAGVDVKQIWDDLPTWTEQAISDNRLKAAQEKIHFASGSNPIKHVIYIIKENRTYDQVLGDLEQDGKPVGNGDPQLTMYGAAVTPNIHKLALRFGVLDNFYDSGEVSGDGHVWSNAAIGTDYLEKTWQQSYRGGQRTYDYEGVVAEGLPLEQNIPDVNEPASGYLWGNLAAHGKSYYHFGEYIATKFCDEVRTANPQQGPMLQGQNCAHPAVKPGQQLPANWGGGVNQWPWAIPIIASNTATKPELVGHFAKEAPDFNLWVPDQIRVNIFEQHLNGWIADMKNGKDTMPNFVMLRLGDDHTMGTRPGGPTPNASVADNDLAVGRAVDLISHSPFWDSTAFFILEDDAQDGADHVDAHRSYALVVSKYAPHGKDGHAYVDSHFYSTVSVIRTMESLLGLPPMNNNDAFAPMIGSLFTGRGNQAPYVADASNRENGLIYKANKKSMFGAMQSMKMDFRHADRAPAQQLNVILWKAAKGDAPVPAMITAKKKAPHKDDDDD